MYVWWPCRLNVPAAIYLLYGRGRMLYGRLAPRGVKLILVHRSLRKSALNRLLIKSAPIGNLAGKGRRADARQFLAEIYRRLTKRFATVSQWGGRGTAEYVVMILPYLGAPRFERGLIGKAVGTVSRPTSHHSGWESECRRAHLHGGRGVVGSSRRPVSG